MATRGTRGDEQHIRFQECPREHPTMASEEPKRPFDEAEVQQITEIVKGLLRNAKTDDVAPSAPPSQHANAPTRASSLSSNVVYPAQKTSTVLSPEWYKELRRVPIRAMFTTPPSRNMPDFFRITDPLHNSTYAGNSITSEARSEADALYQIQAFVHENLNRQFSVADELSSVDLPKALVDVIEDNWRHLYGISEMIQARYDILCGKLSEDQEQTRLLDLYTRPPVGTGSIARSIHRNLRQLWTSDAANRGAADTVREVIDSEVLTRDGDLEPYMHERDLSLVPLHRDKFGLATTWDRVAQIENKDSGGRVKAEEGSFVYVMRSHDLIKERNVYSLWYSFGGFRWRLLLFPQGERNFDDLMTVYLVCGGPSDKRGTEDDGRLPESANAMKQNDGVDWFCTAEFSLRLLHPTSPIAKEALRRDLGECQDPLDLQESSTTEESQGTTCPDLVEEFYHVFRYSSDDWGGGVAPFSMLQPGKYADKDMNLVFLVSIRLES